jgi:hypothetical protein
VSRQDSISPKRTQEDLQRRTDRQRLGQIKTDRDRDRQTDRKTDRQTDADRHTYLHTYIHTYIKTDRHNQKRQTDRQRQTERQIAVDPKVGAQILSVCMPQYLRLADRTTRIHTADPWHTRARAEKIGINHQWWKGPRALEHSRS